MKSRKSDGRRFRDLPPDGVEYRGRGYRAWTLDVGLGYDVTFADIGLYYAMLEHGDLDGPLDCGIAYYVDPDEIVGEAVRQFLE